MLRIGYATGGDCGFVTTQELGLDPQNSAFDKWPTGKDGAGYDKQCDCYCWGYRPVGHTVYGLGGTNRAHWKICTPGAESFRRACADCPECPKPSPAPLTTTQQSGVDAWGVSLGWVLAAAVLGGGGYYAYKKGVFKKKRR